MTGRESQGKSGASAALPRNGKWRELLQARSPARATAHSLPTEQAFFLQFIKGQWKSGEREVLRGLPGVDLEVTGRGFTIEQLRNPRIPLEDHAAAAHGWQVAQTIVGEGNYDVVVLDEILGAVKAGLVPLDELLALVHSKPAELHLALTGRDASAELIEIADLVSEVQPIKHPLQQGIKAQRGIEF